MKSDIYGLKGMKDILMRTHGFLPKAECALSLTESVTPTDFYSSIASTIRLVEKKEH